MPGKTGSPSLFEAEQTLFLWLFPTTALLTGLLAYVGIVSSLKSIAYLRHLYEDHEQVKASADGSTDRLVIARSTPPPTNRVEEKPMKLRSPEAAASRRVFYLGS